MGTPQHVCPELNSYVKNPVHVPHSSSDIALVLINSGVLFGKIGNMFKEDCSNSINFKTDSPFTETGFDNN